MGLTKKYSAELDLYIKKKFGSVWKADDLEESLRERVYNSINFRLFLLSLAWDKLWRSITKK